MLSPYIAMVQLKRSGIRQDPGLGQPEGKGKSGKNKVFTPAMPPYLLR